MCLLDKWPTLTLTNPAPVIWEKAETSTRVLTRYLPCFSGHGAQKPTNSAKEYRRIVPNPRFDPDIPRYKHPNRANFADNRICTTKYNLLTFLPKNLFEQFHRAANLYFIAIVFLNIIIGAFGRYVSMIPILFVLSVTALKDIFEDYRRYKSDLQINHSKCRVWDNDQKRYRKLEWCNVLVGDFVHLSCNEIIPADILILRSSDPNGVCYVETSNLDGESNLKQRQIIGTMSKAPDTFEPPDFNATIYCEHPNNQIYRFNGYVEHEDGVREPVDKLNLLLRGCEVRNTDFVEGIVIYAGGDTKAMLNNSGPRYKRSGLEKLTNLDITWCVVLLLVMCISAAVFSSAWLNSFEDPFKVLFLDFLRGFVDFKPSREGFINFWYFIIVLQVMIPISLYVSIEIIKLGQIYFMSQDLNMYNEEVDRGIECRALNIPEELGQIQYVLSDKTGTLTENQMIFRRCFINGKDYGVNMSSDTNVSYKLPSIGKPKFYVDKELREDLKTAILLNISKNDLCFDDNRYCSESNLFHFFVNMALCNTVVVNAQPHKDEMDEFGSIASNLFAMNNAGFQNDEAESENLSDISQKSSIIQLPSSAEVVNREQSSKSSKLLSLHLSKFNKALKNPLRRLRKHTSSAYDSSEEQVVANPIYEAESPDELALVNAASEYGLRLCSRYNHSVKLQIAQTSDVLIYKVNYKNSQNGGSIYYKAEDSISTYGSQGLRTLCLCRRILSDEDYKQWKANHERAEMALSNREKQISDSANAIERELELLGITAIEDRLQDGVPQCIEALRNAGINVWVLTGDRIETAVNIAYASRLFSSSMDLVQLSARNEADTAEMLKLIEERMSKGLYVQEKSGSLFRQCVTLSGDALSSGNSSGSVTVGTSSSNNLSFNCKSSSMQQRKYGVVVSGQTLANCLLPTNIPNFLKIIKRSTSVLCSRATPLQKASVVKLVKEHLSGKVLAIGDGANDVSMIQCSDVGVGILGQEGMQAVMSSDFALTRFRYLEQLLLVHGHWCYHRLAIIILYFFYKNAVRLYLFVFVLYWCQLFNGFSAQVPIDPIFLMLYNLIFTSVPPLIYGITEQDAPADFLLKFPHLYGQGRHSELYLWYSFWINMLDALWQSAAIYLTAHLAYNDSVCDIWTFGFVLCSQLVVINSVHLAILVNFWTVPLFFSIVLSFVVYMVFAFIYNLVVSPAFEVKDPPLMMAFYAVSDIYFWLVILFSTAFAVFPRMICIAIKNTVKPSVVKRQLFEEARRQKRKSKGNVVTFLPSVQWKRGIGVDPITVTSSSGDFTGAKVVTS
uniref:Phospholipid-transporting ATPase n=1 Tax=Syphacia muris TaxID=451379 RepID=A0A0N5A897_9BILA